MRILPFICLLVGCCLAAPSDSNASEKADNTIVANNYIKEDYVIYTAEHDIVRIFAPLNQFKFKQDPWAEEWTITGGDSSSEEDDAPRKVFFAEAETSNGERTDKGFYVYNAGKVTKLLKHGRDAVANNENVIYIGASNGIYKYDEATNKAERHGIVTDDIIQLAFYNVTNTIYIVTADHEVFKLDAAAEDRDKVEELKDVQALVFGYDRKMYYYDSQANVYVYDHVNNVAPKKIEGLPAKIDKIALIPPLMGMEEGAILLVNNEVYLIKSDAEATKTKIRVEGNPTAYEPKPTYVQFYAENKKLYELDVLKMTLPSFFSN